MTRPSWQDFGTFDESAHPQLWDGVVGAWCPSLGPTGSRLHDMSGRSNWGTLTNMDNATDWVVDGGQYALDFDGSNDYVQCGLAPVLRSQFAISLWFRPTSLAKSQVYLLSALVAGGGDNSYSVIYEYVDDTVEFYHRGTVLRANSQIAVTETTWTHIAYSYDGATMRAYKNGAQVNSQAAITTLETNVGNLLFASFADGGQFAQVQMDDIRIYNRPLAAAETAMLASYRGVAYERKRRTLRRYRPEPPLFQPYWALQRNQTIGGGLR
jgi:hypothetical protein